MKHIFWHGTGFYSHIKEDDFEQYLYLADTQEEANAVALRLGVPEPRYVPQEKVQKYDDALTKFIEKFQVGKKEKK